MPGLPTVADAVTRRLPKMISPRGHAIADYISVGLFFAAGTVFWKRNRPAAVAAFLCGGTGLLLNLLTDYPGGVAGLIGLPAHRRFDLALAGVTASMPEILIFRDGRTFFLAQAGAITASTNLTAFTPPRNLTKKRPFRVA